MKLFIHEAAEDDILHEIERYASLDVPHVGKRFQEAVTGAFDRILANPLAGAPKTFRNPALAGLRTWPVKGFADFRIYYLTEPEALVIVRILHGKRDVSRILNDD